MSVCAFAASVRSAVRVCYVCVCVSGAWLRLQCVRELCACCAVGGRTWAVRRGEVGVELGAAIAPSRMLQGTRSGISACESASGWPRPWGVGDDVLA